jgi:23S rRNA (uracil1939-C5)-methyltransferase
MARVIKLRRPQNPAPSSAPAAEVIFDLQGIAPTGEAIGRHAGMVVFVPFGLPGERVRVRLVEQKRSFARGEIIELLAESPARVEPLCPYFGACGGCDWQHIAYSEQLRLKTAIVAEQLTRIGKLANPPVRACVASPQPYEYRNHVRLHVTAEGRLGYRSARSHRVVPVTDCPIAEPPVRGQLSQMASALPLRNASGEYELRSWSGSIPVNGFDFGAGDGMFFQANTAVAGLLVDAVLAALNPQGNEQVLDLYCGVGLFTIPVGKQVAQITGVEANAAAASAAQRNLLTAGVRGHVVAADVATALRDPAIGGRSWDAVLLDPPRTGVDAAALEALARIAALRLFYVSCEPATLSRDLHALALCGYRLQWAQPFDMFPQTRHVETLAVLSL